MKINIKTACGNAPKRIFLKDFNIAYAKGDTDHLAQCLTEDIIWTIHGDQKLEGKAVVMAHLESMKDYKISALILDKVVTHGREGAVNGSLEMASGEVYHFADFYEFKGAKGDRIKDIVSYVIKH